jgi:hypothetical protein
VIGENTEDREPWEFIPDMDTERLIFNKIETEYDVSDLKEVDLEQAVEVGFLAVDGSPAFEPAINATKRESEDYKFGGPVSDLFENGDVFILTYTFEKPILI